MIMLASLGLTTGPSAAAPAGRALAMSEQDTRGQYTQLPMLFERNRGQTDEQVRFLARGAGYSLFLTPAEAVFALRPAPLTVGAQGPEGRNERPVAVIRMSLHGANPSPALEGEAMQAGRSHYFRGTDPAQWRGEVEQYAKVYYRDVYPGVDMVYYGNQQQLEYDFVVEPGRDPQRIAIDFEGVQSLRVNEAGELVLKTPHGEVVQHKPVVYQQVGTARHPVEGQYRVLGSRRVGFEVGGYDESLALVIDPVLAYNTYLGGSGDEQVSAVAVDAAGNVYVTGSSTSVDFPSSGAFAADGAIEDVFVTKFNPHGNAVVYSAYLGGSGGEGGRGIAVGSEGDVYVTGFTTSPDFPIAHANQSAHAGGGMDGFVARLNAAGNALVFSTYLGGALEDSPAALAVDIAGAAYVAGSTKSTDFPVANAFQPFFNGVDDGFVTKFDATGSVAYSTYLGGSGYDAIHGIDVNGSGHAYVAGTTSSTDYPTVNAVQSASAGSGDAFVAKLGAEGNALAYSTYFGGTGDDHGEDVAIDAFGMVFVGGWTRPVGSSNDFPVLAAHQPVAGGGNDGFLVGFDEYTGSPVTAFSTYFGGSGDDVIRDVVANDLGAYTVGYTRSVDLPLLRPAQSANGGEVDAFIGGFFYDGEMAWSTYLGGSGFDYGFAAAGLGLGNLYVAGSMSAFTDMPARGAFRAGSGGGSDAFLVRFGQLGDTRQDFNADGIADVLWRNVSDGRNAIWLSANSNTQQAVTSVTNLDWQVAGTGRFGPDLSSGILWRNRRSGANTIWLSGNDRTQKSLATVSSQDWQIAGVGDFNGDFESDDILWRNNRTGANVIWLSGDHTAPQAVAAVTNMDWRVAGVGDFNGDYTADILWRNSRTGTNSIWLSGNSAVQQAITAVPSQAWQIAGVADFLADGRDDILWHNTQTGANVIWRDGNGASVETLPNVSAPWKISAIDDYSADGRPDILWRHDSSGAHSIWSSGTPTLPQAMTPVGSQSWRIVK